MGEAPKPKAFVKSDSLQRLLGLLENIPGLDSMVGDVVQLVVVLDASYVQRELRWRVRYRRDVASRTSLHEAMASGVLLAFAPTFLNEEIEKYIPKIANETGVTVECITTEWSILRPLIRFYDPLPNADRLDFVDPKDAPYAQTLEQLSADFVVTNDEHFREMGVPVMPSGFDRILRDYARAKTVVLTVKVGSSFVMVGGFKLAFALLTFLAEIVRKLPPAVKILLAASVAAALIHPNSRKHIVDFFKKIPEWFSARRPVAASLSSDAVQFVSDALQQSHDAEKKILEVAPIRRKFTVLAHARHVCMKANQPLSVDDISKRILKGGFVSRSRNFAGYVRSILRKDPRFVVNSTGLWALRGQAAA